MDDREVLIIGAGPVGLTLAIGLGQRGVRCRVLDRKPGPEFLPKMERCNARTMEIFRRLGLAHRIRAAGLDPRVPMDVFITKSMVDAPYVHLPYPSVEAARAEIAACRDTSLPAEPYQLISQYTLEPILREVAEGLPTVAVDYGHEFLTLAQDPGGVTATIRRPDGTDLTLRAAYLAGCDGGASAVRRTLGIPLHGEGDILRLRQALYRCDECWQTNSNQSQLEQ